MTFYPAMIISFYLCGIGPGVLVAILCAISVDYIFAPPHWAFSYDKRAIDPIITFSVSSFIVAVIVTQLRRQSAKSLALLRNASDGIHIHDANGNIIEVSDSFCAMMGYPREEMIGMNISRLDAQFTDAERTLAISQRFAHPGRMQYETRHRRKDGTVFDAEVSAFPLDLGGKPVLFNSSRDITERKKLEEALKENELRYRTVANYTMDWEYWIMPDNSFRYVSPSSQQISGYAPGEFYADPGLLARIIHPEDLHLYTGHRHHLSAQGEAEPLDFRIVTKSGNQRWISHVCRPVYDSAGQYLGQRASNRDITDRKAAEEQIRTLAFYDTLTHLPNRRLLYDRLGQTLAASKRNGHYSAVLFLDLDNFKPLNDMYGHAVGDMLLIEVARRIGACLREVDTVARMGGDEFVVILSKLDDDKAESIAQASVVAEKIRASLSRPYLLKIREEDTLGNEVEHRCTSSIGAVVFTGYEASPDDLIKLADMAMYQAKESGRNSTCFLDLQDREALAAEHGGMMLRLNWHESYNCGEPTIDQEHRKLFELANTLIEAAFARNEKPLRFDSAMEELLLHVVKHFADEEAILARRHYDDLETHALDHKRLIAHALQLRDRAAAGGVTVGELVNFLAGQVVMQHMLKADRKFYPLFAKTTPGTD